MLIRSRAWGFIRAGLNGHYGVRPADLGTGGDFPNILADSYTLPGDADVELVLLAETLPAQGDFHILTDGSHLHGPIAAPPDPWTAAVWYHRPGEATVLEASGSPVTINDGEAADATPIGTAVESEQSQALAATQSLQIGQAAEPEQALALAAVQSASVGVASEAEQALALSSGAAAEIGTALESEQAQALAPVQSLALAAAVESEQAVALEASVPGAVGIAAESEQAFALPALQRLQLGIVVESEQALALAAVSVAPIGLAIEVEQAYALAAVQRLPIGLAVESELARALVAGSTSGGVASPEEVWEGFALEAGLTPGAMLRIVMAAVAGRTDGIGTATERYYSADGAKPRITATFDSLGNRATIVLDGTP